MSTNFDSTKTQLNTILNEINDGKIQLPDFQRGWVWDDDRIKSLIASISQSFPIGAIMQLETGGTGIQFKPRPIEGASKDLLNVEPELLLLDGQQRLTSLFQSLKCTEPVLTKDSKGKKLKKYYFIDIQKALSEEDKEEAIISVSEEKTLKGFGHEMLLDLSEKDSEYKELMFPANSIFDCSEWRREFSKYWDYNPEKMKLFDEFESQIIKKFEQYHLPVIKLGKQTPKEAVCLVFEKVNTGGVSLTVFELLTASFAADNFQLRDDWRDRQIRMKEKSVMLEAVHSDDFLQTISLLVTYQRRIDHLKTGKTEGVPGITCKRKDILKLTIDDYKKYADLAEEGFYKAARFLYNQKIFKARDLPYRTQLVPLASILCTLGEKSEPEASVSKISQWFWCGVLGELYGGAIESRFAKDLPEVIEFVKSNTLPTTIEDANFQQSRLVSLRTRNSAAYKGIYALLMKDKCFDFRTGEAIESQAFFDDKIDVHHIFPQKWCKDNNIEKKYFDSIINKTAISARTNRKIGGNAPSVYLKSLEKDIKSGEVGLDEILVSHRIIPTAMREDDFWSFYNSRSNSLVEVIEKAMGKASSRDVEEFSATSLVDIEDDFDESDA